MLASLPLPDRTVRRAIRVRGLVQGVGFRPFVWRLARELSIAGWVRNDAQGVAIEVQGEAPALDRFMARLAGEAPGLSRIDGIEERDLPSSPGDGFEIAASCGGRVRTGIAADTAVCDACLGELFDPRDRRYRFPFINCTQCGPRFTITGALPYDRANTSMARFSLCGPCRAEFDDPAERRFHAQPNACADCGPSLALLDGADTAMEMRETRQMSDVVATALARLRGGEILAVKGLGGFHLVCDARNREAVAALRARKAREEKPLAVMVAGTASLEGLAEAGAAERALLESRERPIVLLRKHRACDAVLTGVAPGVAWLGAMLPYTPIQYLLFHEAAGRPQGTDWLAEPQPLALVMTSANPGGEPLVTGNEEAQQRLAGIADAFLVHDRDILIRCDDSVARATPRGPAFIRRARGYTPAPVKLAAPGPSVLALGGLLKNTVCVTRGDEAFLSQHVGDLDNAATCRALEEAAAHLLDVLDVTPEVVAHDLHPDFHSTRFAAAFASAHGIPTMAIQHHHAHIAAVAAEHRVRGPVLGLALDGVGLGTDGRAWGGELLRVEGGACERVGHLRELPLPGGDRAAREPWRMGAAVLHALGRGGEIGTRLQHPAAATVSQMLERGFNVPPTSSAGRWFDAAAALLGVQQTCSFEGQAAMLLEGLAARHGAVEALAGGYRLGTDGVLDLLPLLAHLADTDDAAYGAALFHSTVAGALAEWMAGAAGRTGLSRVAFGGGCFVNHVLSSALRLNLERRGLTVLEARAVPPNDGGLALGQAAAAMAMKRD
jgi:hydrogenase maturation protein HypF